MCVNFTGTFFLSNALAIAVLDVMCAAFLVGFVNSWTARLVALLFCTMIPVYVVADYRGWPDHVTYTVIDLIAYGQLWIIGNFGGGVRNLWRTFAGRWADLVGFDFSSRWGTGVVAKDQEPDRR